MNGLELGDLIRNAGAGDWSSLDTLVGTLGSPAVKARSEEDKAQRESEQRQWRQDLLDLFSSPLGLRVLERLADGTVRQPPIQIALGLTSDQVGTYSAYRHGQNSVIHSLFADLKEAGFDPTQFKETPR